MNMLMFDFRESEKEYFNSHDLPDFNIEFIKEPLNEHSCLSAKQLSETDVISVFITSNLTEKVLSQFKNLRMVATRSTGYNHIDLKYCTQNHIAVFNVGTYGENSVAQYTFMLITALVRKFVPAFIDTQKKITEYESYEGHDLQNLSVGILGCGAIGSSVAKIANFFGMRVYVCSPEKNPQIAQFASYCSFEDLLKNSDILTLHLPYCSESYHIINDNAIDKMKNGSYIINTARGELIDIVALYNNLLSGKLAGAALDVLECEDLAVNRIPIAISENNSTCHTKAFAIQKLIGQKNVIITPHIAYNTKESVEILLNSTFNSIRDYAKGLHTNQIR